MEFATQKDNVRDIDISVKNKWRWDWLEDDLMRQYLRKTKVPGQAYCTICMKTLQYHSTGKNDLVKHMISKPHLRAMKTVKTNYSLDSMLMRPSSRSTDPEPVVRPLVPVNDRRMNSEAMILAFMAEHDLPYTLAPDLVKLTQTMAKDPKSLTDMKLERCTASYKMIHGIAQLFTNELAEELRSAVFCLNIDESTNSNNEKIVAVLVSYFSSKKTEILVRHLESFKVIRADAESIFLKIEDMFDRFELSWTNVISVLLDSCNTMRGKKSGLETRLRERAPHLLDIDGDSVHHAHNAAKAFTTPFGYYLESLFNTIHSDFHWSTDLRSELQLICEIIGVKYTVPERFTSHRFLSAYNLSVDTSRLLPAYTVFYFHFITKDERQRMSTIYDGILERKSVSEISKEELKKVGIRLRKKRMTKDGTERKDKIVHKLFGERKKTRLLLGIYMSALEGLKEYAVLFQAKQPMVHILHDKQVELVRLYLGFFVRPECIPASTNKLKDLEITEAILLAKPNMFMGSVALNTVRNSKAKDHIVTEVLNLLQTAYLNSGKMLLKKMPITNALLKNISAIDPRARGHSVTVRHLKDLPSQVKVLNEEEEQSYLKEIYRYQLDPTLPAFTDDTRVDHWWASVSGYPALRKLTLTVLCCFHGPMVEGAFNIMGDIMDCKSSSLSIDSVNALQNIKSALTAKDTTAVQYFSREDVLYTPVVPGLVGHMSKAGRERNNNLMKKKQETAERRARLEITERKVISKIKAKELVVENVKRARIEHTSCNIKSSVSNGKK